MIVDFSGCSKSGKRYGGSEKKLGILWNHQSYMLKFQKKTAFGMRFNHVSEYLGSHIFHLLGIPCQETYLGVYGGEQVVACLDFVSHQIQFVPFNDVGESTLETNKEKYQYSYEDILMLLRANSKLTKVDETVSAFFDVFIVDALIGNFDRHGANWGFLKQNNRYSLAPVFDNGSCLFPNLVDESDIQLILTNEEERLKRVYQFPTSQIKLNGQKSSYFEVISSLCYEECNQALERIYPRIKMNEINRLIDEADLVSPLRKEFYKVIIKERYERILTYSYIKLKDKRNETNRY